jgi:hypothetical protein
MKLKQKNALVMKIRPNANLSRPDQYNWSLKAIMAARLSTNPIEKRNWSVLHQTDCTSLQDMRTTG